MKKYEKPEILLDLLCDNIIMTSPSTEYLGDDQWGVNIDEIF